MNSISYINRFCACFLLLILSSVVVMAQQPSAINGDSVDSTYKSLRGRVASLADREMIISGQLDDAREVFSVGNDAEKEKAGAKIMELERTLFALRSELDEAVAALSSYEAVNEKQLTSTGTSNKNSQKKNLVENDYFKDNLPLDDYRILLQKQALESKVAVKLAELKKGYDNLAILAAAYSLAEKGAQADSIYSRIKTNARKNELLAEEIGNIWGDIFDTKTYAYNYVLDKTGEKELLAGQEEQMNNLYMLEEETIGEYMYDESARYALQKLLLSGYEMRIAEKTGLTLAADSLKSFPATTSHINDYFMPKLDLSERVFYDYAEIAVSRPAKYTSAWQLPEVMVYPRGSMFRVLVGVYSRPPQIATFKGVYPLAQEKKVDGKYYYYAGGYPTADAAETAVAKLKNMGFSNPRVVAWHNGEYDETNSKPIVANSPVSSKHNPKNNGIKYRIEIRNAHDGLSQAVRNVINNGAAGKEISKMTASDNGEPVFIIGAFSNKSLAESLATQIKNIDSGVIIKIIQIQ